MGGTFDPIHLGHLRAAEQAREVLALDRVLFIPAGQPPHRPLAPSSASDRFAMVALATAAHPCFIPSDLELGRNGPSYTVDTLEALRGERPADELVLVVGSDTFPEMTGWRAAERIFSICRVAVVRRPGSASALDAPPGSRVLSVEGPGLDISATEIRRRVREGKSVRYLVQDAVADYIAKRRLFA